MPPPPPHAMIDKHRAGLACEARQIVGAEHMACMYIHTYYVHSSSKSRPDYTLVLNHQKNRSLHSLCHSRPPSLDNLSSGLIVAPQDGPASTVSLSQSQFKLRA